MVLMLLFALDRAVLDGQSAAMLLALLRRGAVFFNQVVVDVVRSMRGLQGLMHHRIGEPPPSRSMVLPSLSPNPLCPIRC